MRPGVGEGCAPQGGFERLLCAARLWQPGLTVVVQGDKFTGEGGGWTQRLNGAFSEKRALRESGLVWVEHKSNM